MRVQSTCLPAWIGQAPPVACVLQQAQDRLPSRRLRLLHCQAADLPPHNTYTKESAVMFCLLVYVASLIVLLLLLLSL